MNNQIFRFRNIVLALSCSAMVFTACNKEEEVADSLPYGQYPLNLQAGVESVVTRVANDQWEADDRIAVSTDGGKTNKTYKVADTNGTLAAVDGDLYWTKQKGQPIMAWYPAVNVEKSIADQSGGYADFDYLNSNGEYDYTPDGVELGFVHAMSRVACQLLAGEISTDGAVISFFGCTRATWANGTLTGMEIGEIKPAAENKALLVPQDMTGQTFIQVVANGRTYTYKPKAGDADLKAGLSYTYKLKLTETEIELVTVEISAESWIPNSDVTIDEVTEGFRIYLNEFTAPENTSDYKVEATNAIEKEGVYTMTKEGTLKISLTANTDYRLNVFDLGLLGKCDVRPEYDKVKRISSYVLSNFATDISINVKAEAGLLSERYDGPVAVGDYFYADGTWGALKPGEIIGVVFKVGKGANENTTYPFGQDVKGYAVALEDAADGASLQWSTEDVYEVGASTSAGTYNGYNNTYGIKEYCANTGKDFVGVYPAVSACLEYGKYKAPAGITSGWFMPAVKEFIDMPYTSIQDKMTPLKVGYYWTSNAKNGKGGNAHNVQVKENGTIYFENKPAWYQDKGNPLYVRPILAF